MYLSILYIIVNSEWKTPQNRPDLLHLWNFVTEHINVRQLTASVFPSSANYIYIAISHNLTITRTCVWCLSLNIFNSREHALRLIKIKTEAGH